VTDRGPPPEALALLDAAPCGLLQTAADGMLLRVNLTFCRWVGHDAEALVGQKRFQDLLSMGARIFHQTHWAPLLRMQGSVSEVKLDVLHRDGSRIPMVINAVRRQEDGVEVHDLAAYVARDRDVYERELVASRKRLEELVAESARIEAEAKDRALFAEQMIGIVSHDLRNPMSAIGLGAALLSRDHVTESQQRTLQRIARSVERANRLITDLLDFTQARIGKGLQVALEAGDLHDAVSNAVDELGAIYPGRVLRHVRVGAGECTVDANRLAQLVGNLVSNAMVYGTADAPVTVQTSVDTDACSISVHNAGSPIPLEMQSRVFEPMMRGGGATTSARSIGLGLFIVRKIAEAHGGTARVTSTLEGGTTFTVTFPRRAPNT
jgi:sigma-B regulation protein RsbU (phosphoserine phosphatase)